jgi:uncharacterized protein (UPF0297 family)
LAFALVWSLTSVAVSQAEDPAWEARHGLTSAAYQKVFDELVGKGYRPVHVSGYAVGVEERYAAIWEKKDGPAWEARHGLKSAEYQKVFDELVGKGYRPVQVSGYAVDGEARYAAIWEKKAGPAWVARHRLTSAEYQKLFTELKDKGYGPVQVSGYAIGAEDRYAAIWEKKDGPAWEARHRLTSAEYQKVFDELVGNGYRPTQVSGCDVDGEARYAAFWEKKAGPAWEARHGLTSAEYQKVFDDLADKGYRLIQVNGYAVGGEARYAAIWEKNP